MSAKIYEVTDQAVVEQVRAGDAERFSQLVLRYQCRLQRACYARLGDWVLAEDAVQESFLRAYSGLRKFRGECPFFCWLYRIAANVCRDLLKQKAAKPLVSWDALQDNCRSSLEARFAMPVEAAAALEHSQTLDNLLQGLSEQERQLILMRELNGFSYADIAKHLQCSVDGVKGRLRRVRRKLDSYAGLISAAQA